jgi:threonine synthase
MQLYSTNKQVPNVGLKEAIFKGLPDDNGLFMPTQIPTMPKSFFDNIDQLTFQEIAFEVCKTLIGSDVPDKDLKKIVDDAFNFEVPAVKVHDNIYCLELFHGPTSAFKDFGGRFMARLMSYFREENEKEIVILVATSGDTGSAVAQGFYKVPGIKVSILYPKGMVSEIQEKQLTTLGENISAFEVEGTFDDCQALVKQAFLDKDIRTVKRLTSANSINISRLIPQSLYYYYAYAQLKKHNKELVISVPSGNFGNLCAGLLASEMGLPVKFFIAATNANDVVPEYLATGKFRPRPSVSTISNAMDVGNPSNFPRIQALYGSEYEKIKSRIEGETYSDKETAEAITKVHRQFGYILDPHGAVGYLALKKHVEGKDNALIGVFLGTAHPAKFIDVVEKAINQKVDIPENLRQVMEKKKVTKVISKNFDQFKKILLEQD